MATLDITPDGTAGLDRYIAADTGSTATDTTFIVGSPTHASQDWRKRTGLIKFDLSTLAGATINSATLYLTFAAAAWTDYGTLGVYRALVSWTESGATWTSRDGTNNWATAGAAGSGTDHASTAMASHAIGNVNMSIGSVRTITLDTTEFASMVAANEGMIIHKGNTNVATSPFASSDHATAGYRPRLLVDYTPASGATVDVAGTLTASGTLVRSVGKPSAGTLATSGTVNKTVSRSVGGTLNTSGVYTASRGFAVAVEGALTTAGVLIKEPRKAVAGTLNTAGTLVKQSGKGVAGTLNTSGTLLKNRSTAFAGTLATAATLVVARVLLQAYAGTLTTSGTFARQSRKMLAGTLVSSGVFARSLNKALAGTLAFGATLTVISILMLALSGALNITATLSRSIGKALASSLVTSGTLVRSVTEAAGGAVITAGAILIQLVTIRAIAGTVSISGTLTVELVEVEVAVFVAGARSISFVEYASPSLVPAGLRAVAFITGTPGDRVIKVNSRWVASKAAAPPNEACYGAVKYATMGLVPSHLVAYQSA